MYLARELSVASYSDIAKEFDMHHSTVMNAIDSVKQRMKKIVIFTNSFMLC